MVTPQPALSYKIPYNLLPWARTFQEKNGVICPWCGARDYPDMKDLNKCWACGELYKVSRRE